jgi:hypothetical protein
VGGAEVVGMLVVVLSWRVCRLWCWGSRFVGGGAEVAGKLVVVLG